VREVTLSKEVERIINRFSGENGSNTPDFILAQFLVNALAAFDAATNRRTEWYQPPDPRPSPDSPGLSVPGLYEAGSAITTELAAIGASAGEIQRLPAVLRIMTRHMTAAAEPAPAEPAPDEPEEVCRKCGWWLSAANRCGKHGGAANATCHCKDWVLRSVLGEDHGREPTLPKRQAKARYTPGPAERRVLEGEPAPDEPDPCPTCHDREYVETADPDGQSRVLGAEECPECGITGRHPCEGRVPPPEQHGTGRAGGGKGAE